MCFNIDIPHCIVLCFIVLHDTGWFFFNELKVYGNPALSKTINITFPTALVFKLGYVLFFNRHSAMTHLIDCSIV